MSMQFLHLVYLTRCKNYAFLCFLILFLGTFVLYDLHVLGGHKLDAVFLPNRHSP